MVTKWIFTDWYFDQIYRDASYIKPESNQNRHMFYLKYKLAHILKQYIFSKPSNFTNQPHLAHNKCSHIYGSVSVTDTHHQLTAHRNRKRLSCQNTMPGLVVFRRRWSAGSDDLVVPSSILLIVHLVWWVLETIIFSSKFWQKEC